MACNQDDKNISVLLNRGDGTFAAATPVSLGNLGTSWPIAAVIADFNGDGKMDVAVATAANGSSGSTVLILLGNGDGTLQAPVSFAAGASPLSVITADINGDHKLDLLVGGNGAASTLLGNGDGTFQAPTLLPGLEGRTIGADDLNGDGFVDVFTGSSDLTSDFVSVYLNDQHGGLQAPTAIPLPQSSPFPISILSADLNHDGKADILIADYYDGIFVLLGNGDGTFQTPVLYSGGYSPSQLAVADFDNDGKLDVINSDYNDATSGVTPQQVFGLRVSPGLGDGTFDEANGDSAAGRQFSGLAVADFNHDGYKDVVAVERSSNSVFVLLNGGATTLTLASNPALSAGPGQPVTFTTTVAPRNGVALPTGTVTLMDGTTAVGTGTLDSTGVASVQTTLAAPIGFHYLTAFYNGDSNYPASSAQEWFEVGYATTTNVSASANPAAAGSPVTYTAMVTSSQGTPTGRVSFYDNTSLLGTINLTAGSASITEANVAAGTHAIIASYRPDTSSPTLLLSSGTLTVTAGTVTTATLSVPNNLSAGASFNLQATVTSGQGVPTGTVTFKDGTTSIGTASLVNGVATLAQTATSGSHSYSAVYAGGAGYLSSTSPNVNVTINADFTLSSSSSTASITAGQSANFTLSLNPQPGGFTQAVQLTCSGAPQGSTCTVTPSTITPGSTTASAMVTFTTTAATATRERFDIFRSSGVVLAMCFPLGLVLLPRKGKHALGLMLLVVVGAGIVGCGGSNTPKPSTQTGTPRGNYVLTVTATSGSVQHTTTYNVTVN